MLAVLVAAKRELCLLFTSGFGCSGAVASPVSSVLVDTGSSCICSILALQLTCGLGPHMAVSLFLWDPCPFAASSRLVCPRLTSHRGPFPFPCSCLHANYSSSGVFHSLAFNNPFLGYTLSFMQVALSHGQGVGCPAYPPLLLSISS